ncbi:MAG: DNA gyrase subunit A [Candidatus Marsarchaeota archaeon]|nr:DNA gyrase subunit A [Candidatus Marsarchaeota archaeon]
MAEDKKKEEKKKIEAASVSPSPAQIVSSAPASSNPSPSPIPSTPASNPNVHPRPLEKEMHASYLDYAMSVIVGRALPDVRDGFKPVHRRVLFAMYELSNTHDKPYKKSARVVGEVLGKYHPHGDTAIYDSLVRMAQDFSLRYPLVDGQGNFGSVDGDNPAAMRYTEVRMAKIADEMLLDIDKDTVDFTPNFDGTLKEPAVLPSKLPNLLINGSSGIAVGMATNIPPHNLGEVCDALTLLLSKPEATSMDLAQVVRGPDFPTGAQILGRSGILEAYSTGRGSVKVRAVAEILDSKKEKGRKAIKITELPYQVNKAELVKTIAEMARDKKIEGIADIQDRSDKDGLEIHIELKRDANADIVLNHLYAKTSLETSFGIITIALVNGEPKTLSLRDMLHEFVQHRRVVIRRRSQFELTVAKERKHILDGLKIALADIDKVINAIKSAKDPAIAKTALMSGWKLSEKQALAILDTKLSRLTSLERDKIDEENAQLSKLIALLESILADPKKIDGIIRSETAELKSKYGNKRKTAILEDADEGSFEAEDLIPDEAVAVMISEDGYIKRISIDEYKSQRRGGRGVKGSETKEEDRVKDILIARTHDTLLFFTTAGQVHWLKVYKIPPAGRYAMGKALVNLLDIGQEKISCWIEVREFSDKEFLLMATKKGTVKRSSLSDYSRPRRGGIRAITLRDGDELIRVRKTGGKSEILLASALGQSIRFAEDEVREIGRAGQGVKGIELDEKDEVIGFCLCDRPTVLTVCENGYGKRTPIEEYRLQGRAGSGIINIKTEGRNGKVVSVKTVSDEDEILCVSSKGQVIRMPVKDISIVGRNTMGVRLMKLDEGERVVAVEHLTPEPSGENGNGKMEGDGKNKIPA